MQPTEAHRQYKLLVIAVRQGSGELIVNPDVNYVFELDDIAILMGSRKQIERFRQHHR